MFTGVEVPLAVVMVLCGIALLESVAVNCITVFIFPFMWVADFPVYNSAQLLT